MALSIRPIEPKDRADWQALWRAYLEFYETSVSDDVYDTTFGRLCDPARDAQQGLMAFDGCTAVGLVHYIFHVHNWRVDDVCYLQDLYASPDVRGTGVGRALIEAVYARADANGTPAVYWLTQDFNATARLLYDRIGTVTPFIKYNRS
ncbi:MAG: GNAT family N-acetyltransferase [Pseudomonadota bacterium]